MKDEKPRSLLLFEQSIKSEKTLAKYNDCLKHFLNWSHKDHDSLLLLPTDQIQILLEDYLLYLKPRIGYSAINLVLAAIGKFLEMNDKEYNQKKLRRLLPERRKTAGKRAYANTDIQKMLEFADNLRNKALIHFFAASGCRPGVIEELKWKHLAEVSDDCYAITAYAGSMHESVTFLHSEARHALDEYTNERRQKGEPITPESYVFPYVRRVLASKPRPMTGKTASSTISRILAKARIVRIKADEGHQTRYDKSTVKGFRTRFNTIMKNNPQISYSIAEKMMDHTAYLEPIYHDTTDVNKFFEEYKKAIPELIIDDSERDKIKIRKLEGEKSELEKSKIEVDEMRKRLENLEYGAEAREATYAKNMLRFRQQKDRVGEVISMLSHYLFERQRTEEEKREFLKRIKKAKENGEEMDAAWLLETLGYTVEDLEKVNNNLRDLPELRNIFSEFIQTVIQKGRNFNNYSIPTLLTG